MMSELWAEKEADFGEEKQQQQQQQETTFGTGY